MELWISLAICAVTSAILKFTWYDHLGPGEMYWDQQPKAALAETSISQN
jgi:hypothetical protein